MSAIAERQLEANGLSFSCLEAGEGPLVLLLHGFPDNAWTWDAQLARFAEAGYHAVAPFLRGYPPTQLPPDGRYEPAALGEDVACLVEALGGGPARVVGHDWGAVMAYAAMAFAPESVSRTVVVSVNHPRLFPDIFSSPERMHRSFHLWLLQLDGYAELAVRANDLALIDYLWRLWSPGVDHGGHVDHVKRDTLALPGAVEAALGYYRALLAFPRTDPTSAEQLFQPTSQPTLAIFGADDPIAQPIAGEEGCFSGDYRCELLAGAGHFVHRDRPDEVEALILDWLTGDAIGEDPSGWAGSRSS
jgi:pimeloyl-ACP methyl ester carboxylesterase